MRCEIVVLPGDGIGKEVTGEAVKVCRTLASLASLDCSFRWGDIGGRAVERWGVPLPEETLTLCQQADAVLFGAVGGPQWDTLAYDLRPERGLLQLRKALNLYANLRPAKVLSPLIEASTLKREVVEGIDILVVRELTGGIYFGAPRGIEITEDGEKAVNTMVYTRQEIEQIVRLAFELARQRRKKLTSVDKANVLEVSELWRKIVNQISAEYPEVEVSHLYVDNCAMQLVRDPRQFDVIVTGNLFGDILSDEAAMLTGSIGMLPSASLRGRFGLYEPVHGSAPDIAGQDRANPIAAILSVAMMFHYTFHRPDLAHRVERAVEKVLAKGYRTPDLQGPYTTVVGTKQMGDLICQEMEQE
ncbi:MAG: 3-isopropylmalate dehydrogenase [Nitrospinota bacterium]|nr:MAG: 3-isopropylmalate dehydrogenase [Nitrospinota bacterium]